VLRIFLKYFINFSEEIKKSDIFSNVASRSEVSFQNDEM